jgi:phosphoglucosamine mutase
MIASQRKLFGTDGIRGVAGEFPLSPEGVHAIGYALGHDLGKKGGQARVVIGQDTRKSSATIADQLSAGLRSAGCEVHSRSCLPCALPQVFSRRGDFSVAQSLDGQWHQSILRFGI